MAGYFLFELDIFNEKAFSHYATHARELLRQMGGEIVLNSQRVIPLEGGWNPPAVVMAKFSTLEAARRFYECDEYRSMLALRNGGARSRGVLIESQVPLTSDPSANAAVSPAGASLALFGLDYTRGMQGFEPAADPRMEERELGLGAVSGQRVTARLVRARGHAGAEPLALQSTGHCLIYVVRGSAIMSEESEGTQRLVTASAACLPPGTHYQLADWSFDFEMLVLSANASTGNSSRQVFYDHERDDSHAQGPAGREYLLLRNLRVAQMTERQMEVTVIKVRGAPPEGTGWHTHTNSEWVFILSGAAELGSERMGNLTIRAGDSLTFPPGSVHAVHTFSDDYSLIAVNVPADFSTHAAAGPEHPQSHRSKK